MHTSVVVSSTTSACPDVCSDVHVVSRTGSLVSIADSVSGGGYIPTGLNHYCFVTCVSSGAACFW